MAYVVMGTSNFCGDPGRDPGGVARTRITARLRTRALADGPTAVGKYPAPPLQ